MTTTRRRVDAPGPKPLPPSAPELPRGSGDPPGEFAAQIMALLDEYRAAGLTRDWPYPPPGE